MSAGIWDDSETAIAATVRLRSQVEPVAEWIEPYREAGNRYRSLYPALKSLSQKDQR